ncbi:unnamed protein product [Mytilus edulis]|uniref:Uncharacterized protein n=1 Tax=Mytilus edulis TaxID=6550 RepID=A0A8S3T8M6_MYTED|nr:unnamed protein product [Mytilus edulis]
MTWIGLVWDMEFGKLRVSSERIDRLVDVISKILFCVGKGKMLHSAKFVAGIVGQIISMQAVLGNLVRLRTRELYNCILLRASWKSLVALTAPAVEELRYWLNSVTQLNEQGNDLHESDVCDLVAFTDASEVGFGGYIVPAVDGICAESVCDSLEILTDCGLELPDCRHHLHHTMEILIIISTLTMLANAQLVTYDINTQSVCTEVERSARETADGLQG